MERRSLRIVLATVGSRGDVQPMLAMARTLSSRGHLPHASLSRAWRRSEALCA